MFLKVHQYALCTPTVMRRAGNNHPVPVINLYQILINHNIKTTKHLATKSAKSARKLWTGIRVDANV